MIGGSGSLNAMIYMRGLPSDYDGWQAMGCPGWAWADVRPSSQHSCKTLPLAAIRPV